MFENRVATTPEVRAPDSAFITTLDAELHVRIPDTAAKHAPAAADTGPGRPSAFVNVKASLCATNPVLRRLLDSLPQMTCQMSAASMTTNWLNKRWYEYTGMHADGPGRHRDFLHPDDRPAGAAAITSAMRTRQPFVFEARVRGADGDYRWHTAHGEPVCNDNGDVALWVAVATDTSAQKQLQQDLETETALLHTALDQLPVSVVVTTADGVMQFANKAAREGARHAPV
jgi:PAS domain S-box-containing protein